MSSFDYSSVWLCRLLVLILTLCLGSEVVLGQRFRISDGDVDFLERGEEEGGRPRATENITNHVSKRRSLGQLKVDRRPEAVAVRQAIYKEAARYNIDPNLVVAIVWQESRFRSDAVSEKNARGLMQLMPETAAKFNVRAPHDRQESIRGGVAYLVWLLDRFNGNVALALAAYNAGPGSVEAYLYGRRAILSNGKVINRRGIRNNGIPPYAETVNYVRNIALRYRLLRMSTDEVAQ
ncbi:MAG TPA: lytic transglycosylase domain-containing protein [Pyrinomonadaceae bacterium]|nr:lytic transglycosylase domain-containing protein [Pyrinomonadaceae bacterium]